MNHRVFATFSHLLPLYVLYGISRSCPSPRQLSLHKLKKIVPHLSYLESFECESCHLGKHVRVSFPSRINDRVMSPFDVVYFDVWDPSHVPSVLRYTNYVTFIDDFSCCTWIFLMNRFELFNIFNNFCSEIKTQFGKTIRILRSDNVKEYFSDCFNSLMTSHGIIHQSCCQLQPSKMV